MGPGAAFPPFRRLLLSMAMRRNCHRHFSDVHGHKGMSIDILDLPVSKKALKNDQLTTEKGPFHISDEPKRAHVTPCAMRIKSYFCVQPQKLQSYRFSTPRRYVHMSHTLFYKIPLNNNTVVITTNNNVPSNHGNNEFHAAAIDMHNIDYETTDHIMASEDQESY
jgi:hypothetical protein